VNCTEWEERIALHAEGDLPQQERPAAEQHLGECPNCRKFLEELKQSLGALRAAHAEPPAASAFTVVRAQVLAEIGQPRGRAGWLGWIGASAAAAAVLATLLVPRPVPPPKIAAAPPVPVAIVPAAPVIAPPATPVPRRKRRTRPRPEPLVVKLITDDPNVVIYWITN
jgi:anti-sigma factor RsiW